MNTIDTAVKILNDGGIIIFPTDTAYGIGCRIDKKSAVERLFHVRNRPHEKATPVLVSGIEMAREYLLEIPHEVEELLMKKYWPGGLTVVLPCKKDLVLPLVRGGGDTLGVRMPNHEIALEIIKSIGVPILGPSANFADDTTPYAFSDLDPKLVELVDYPIEGEVTSKKSSTVIDCSTKPWRILREGAVKIEL